MRDEEFLKRLEGIREDRQGGASEIAREALRLVAECARGASMETTADLISMLRGRAAALAAARPSMAPLRNLMTRWAATLDGLPQDPYQAARRVADAAEDLADLSREAVREAAARLASLVEPGSVVMTHSLSSTVVELFRQLRHRGVTAIITESRPLLEGHALAAKLDELAIETVLITDAQMGLSVRDASLVVVGADSVLADGSVVNKAGTYLLALAARDAGVPFYVCCESFKRCPPDMLVPPLDSMDTSELGAPRLPHVTAANIYFDLTPATLISACFTENGKDT